MIKLTEAMKKTLANEGHLKTRRCLYVYKAQEKRLYKYNRPEVWRAKGTGKEVVEIDLSLWSEDNLTDEQRDYKHFVESYFGGNFFGVPYDKYEGGK